MTHDKNSKTKRVVITLPEWENELLEMLSDCNPKSDGNKANNVRALYHYGFVLMKQQFSFQTKEDCIKNLKIIRSHSSINFEETIKNFHNQIKGEKE